MYFAKTQIVPGTTTSIDYIDEDDDEEDDYDEDDLYNEDSADDEGYDVMIY